MENLDPEPKLGYPNNHLPSFSRGDVPHLGCRSDDPWSNLVKRLGASGLSEDGFNKLFLFFEKMVPWIGFSFQKLLECMLSQSRGS